MKAPHSARRNGGTHANARELSGTARERRYREKVQQENNAELRPPEALSEADAPRLEDLDDWLQPADGPAPGIASAPTVDREFELQEQQSPAASRGSEASSGNTDFARPQVSPPPTKRSPPKAATAAPIAEPPSTPTITAPQVIHVPVHVPVHIPVPVAAPVPPPALIATSRESREDSDVVAISSADDRDLSPGVPEAPVAKASVAPKETPLDEAAAPESGDSSQSRESARLQYTKSRDRLLRAVERGRHALFRLQDPIPQKPPRAVEKLTSALNSTSADDPGAFIAKVERLGATQSPSAIDTLRDFVGGRQRSVRVACIQALSMIPHASSSLILLGQLQERSTDILDAATRGLLALGYEESIPAVLALGLTNARQRSVLYESVSALDDDAKQKLQQPLKREMESPDSEVAALAVALLSRLGDTRLDKVFIRLTRHESPVVRAAAVEALDQCENKQVVKYVNAAMTDPAAEVRAAAARGLKKLQSPRSMKLLAAGLQDPEVSVRRVVAKTLCEIGGDEATSALASAIESESDEETTLYMLEGLSKAASNDAFSALVRLLNSENADVRHGAIAALRRLKNAKATPHLVRLMDSENGETRRLVIETLGKLGATKVAPKLRDRVRNDTDEEARAAAARALGELRDTESVTLLEESLHDGRSVRCQAVIALGQIGKKTSSPALLVMLKDAAPEIRYHACNAVAQIGELSNPEPLKALLDDSDAMVRRGAEAALKKLGVKTSGTTWLRPLKKRVRKIASIVLPDVAAGGVPMAGVGIVAAAILVVLGIGYAVYQGIDRFATGGSTFSGPVSYVISASVNADSSQIAVLRNRGVVESWNASDGTLVNRFAVSSPVNKLLCAGDDSVLLFSSDGMLEWNPLADPNGYSVHSIPGDNVALVQQVVRLPDGKTAFLFSGQNVSVIDLMTRKIQRSFKLPGSARDPWLSPDQELMLCGGDNGDIQILSAKDGTQQMAFPASRWLTTDATVKPRVTDLGFSHDGQFIAISYDTGNVQIFEVAKAARGPVRTLNEDTPVEKLVFHPLELKLILVNHQGIHVLSDMFEKRDSIETDDLQVPTGMQLSADGATLVAFVDEVKDVWVFDLNGMKLKHRLSVDSQ
ncbi:MAG: HEAT repeat domain-containing protein [Planctomycetaceae bacterium]